MDQRGTINGGQALSDSEQEELTQQALDHFWLQNHQWNDLVQPGALTIMARGDGCYVWDITGKQYIDTMAGLYLANIGHGRSEVADAVATQLTTLEYSNSGAYANIPAVRLATKLAELTPGDLTRVFFCGGGSEAVEVALKMAKQYQFQAGFPKRNKIITRRGQYHGSSFAAMSLGARARNRGMFEPLMEGVVNVGPPYCYRCPWHLTYPSCAMQCVQDVERVIEFEGPETIAAMIATPIAAGNQIPPDEYWPQVKQILDKHGILLIMDEIICGFGRTGRWFGNEHWGVVPDIMTMAKALTGGYQPVGAVIATRRIADRFLGERRDAFAHGVTYGAHPGVMAAGLKTLEIMEREHLVEHSAEMGEYLYQQMLNLYERHEIVGLVGGGKGLLMTLELVKDRKSKEPLGNRDDNAFGKRLQTILAEKGLAIRGGQGITLSPPLTITRPLIDEVVTKIDEALLQVESEPELFQ